MLTILTAIIMVSNHAPIVPMTTITESMDLVINEIMIRPLASSTAMGQWIELYNNGDYWVNLSDWSIINQSGDIIQFSSHLIPPKSYFIIGASAIAEQNGFYTPDAVWNSFSMSASGSLLLTKTDTDVQEYFNWDGDWNIVRGASLERLNPGWAASPSASWMHSKKEFGAGDKGTPGEQNSVFSNSFGQNSWAFIKAFVH